MNEDTSNDTAGVPGGYADGDSFRQPAEAIPAVTHKLPEPQAPEAQEPTLVQIAQAQLGEVRLNAGLAVHPVYELITGITSLVEVCYGQAKLGGWWTDIHTGQPKDRNDGEMFMLQVSEIAEAMEGHRKNKMDPNLPHLKNVVVELADCVIRIADYCGGRNLDLAGAIVEKLAYNAQRADHKIENRLLDDGKKY